MKLALIQEKQNRLYRFRESELRFEEAEVRMLQMEMIEQNLALLRRVDEERAQLALTSEAINFPGQPFRSALSPYQAVKDTQEYLLSSCSEIAQKKGICLAVGMFRAGKNQKLYNSAVVFDGQGKEVFSYDKNFLAGEEKEYLTPGREFPVWQSEFGRIGIGICWDMQFPETARSYAGQGADLILCPTWGWEEIYGRSRAYENGIYVASAMAVPAWKPIEGRRTPSQTVGPDGAVLAQGPADRAEVVYSDLGDIRDCREMRRLHMEDLKWRLSGKENV